MEEENVDTVEVKSRWFIDFDWHQENKRSAVTLTQSCLCPKCSERFKKGKIKADDLVANIKNCCSKEPRFITDKLQILESIFRLFLAYGNEPLDLEEMGMRLSEWRGGDAYRTSTEILYRLLASDQYYGFREVQS